MNDFKLASPKDVVGDLAELLTKNDAVKLEAGEEVAFNHGHLYLGTIALAKAARSQGDDAPSLGVKYGAFEWKLPDLIGARNDLIALTKATTTEDRLIDRALDAIACVPYRAGLLLPRFDPRAIEVMSARRPYSVVTDTSAIFQGASHFVATYMLPAARIKVPAIAQMEIVNKSESFLSRSRAVKIVPRNSVALLTDHVQSQGAQRALIRLELEDDVEVERTHLLGDPIRSAFQPDKESGMSDLNINVPIRAYVDRLILEAARAHQTQVNAGHSVHILTADQGLARMAIAEGIQPLYFRSVSADRAFGRTLSGVTVNPISGRFCYSPLTKLLWEIATSFGSVKLAGEAGDSIEIAAYGKDLPWSPYQSMDDLLWIRKVSKASDNAKVVKASDSPFEIRRSPDSTNDGARGELSLKNRIESALSRPAKAIPAPEGVLGSSPQRFNVQKMIDSMFIVANGKASEKRISKIVGGALSEYRRFLLSAAFIEEHGSTWNATDALLTLVDELRDGELADAKRTLSSAPSMKRFFDNAEEVGIGNPWNLGEFQRAGSGYIALAEIVRFGVFIKDEGFYVTPLVLPVSEFSVKALDEFRKIEHGGIAASGEWLEAMVRLGIHPDRARSSLDQASRDGKLIRSTEGSTAESRYAGRTLSVLKFKGENALIEKINMYQSDFLTPGKSSTSLRISEIGA